MSEATLEELAYSLGIEKSVSAMSEAEKAQLRYIQIMKSSSDWQADMGKTLMSPANALRVVKQQFSLLTKAIGNVFIPIVMLALPYVVALTEMLTSLAKVIANFVSNILGIKIDFGLDDSSFGDITTGLEDIGTEADKTKNKLNTMLAPFDELNVVQEKSKSDGEDDGGLGGDLGVPLPAYDALSKLTDKFQKNIEKAKKKLKALLPIVSAIGLAFLGWKLAGFISDISESYKNMNKLSKLIARITAGIALITIGFVIKYQGDKGAKFNPEDLWKNLAMQLGGSLSIGAGAYLITKNFTVSAVITGVSLMTSGVATMSHGEESNMWAGIAQTLGGIGLAAGSTFSKTHSVELTILVTLGMVLIGLGQSIQELIDLDPTKEELQDAFMHMFDDTFFGKIGQRIGDGLYVSVKKMETIPKLIYDSVIQPIISFFTEIGNTIGDAVYNGVQTILGIPEWINTNVIKPVTNFFSDMWNSISDFAYDTWEGIQNVWISVSSWFVNNIISPIKNLFSDMWSGIKNLSSDTWLGIKYIWSVVSTWFNDTIIKPVSGFFVSMWDGIKSGASNAWNGVKSVFSGIVGFFSGIANNIKSMFSNIGTTVVNAISSTFKSVLNGAFSVVENLVNGFISGLNGAIGVINKIPGVKIKKISKLYIPRFEDGGYPNKADLFFANENGIPEMVGRIGNQTAVANNDQIATSLTNALISALDKYDFGGNNNPTTIYIGNKKVYEGYGEYSKRENDRYGTIRI